MRKYLLSAALILAATPAFAATEATPNTNLTGPYIGVYGGHDWTNGDIPGSVLDGWEAGVFAGYKLDKVMDWSQGYVFGGNAAIEGFYGLSDSEGSNLSKDDEWGVSFRPGLSVLDAVSSDIGINPYLILGYRNTDFDGGGSDRFDGFELGVGTELVAFGNMGLRVDYSHTWYGEENGVDPESNDVRAGVSYHF